MNNGINLNKKELTNLIQAYTDAVAESKSNFVFQGELLDVGYAKYLIEYATQLIFDK